jgi:predicted ATPase/serine/threonine protein kinase
MTPEQYERVAHLYHAALDLPRERRDSFLAGACAGDESLRIEVESLLSANEAAGDFILTSAMSVSAQSIADDEDAAVLAGTIGAYDILSLIGRGGMGEVYQAHDTRLGRNVALKLLRPALTGNPDAVRRFEQEARAASSLNHPNIVTIYEIGDMNGRRFLAMELVEGQSLSALVGRHVGLDGVARLGAQLARALSIAHAAGIVHRDIKPENIMVRADGYVKLLDFGLARLVPPPVATSLPDDAATRVRTILGTPRYMSPEQARGETVTGASDVFSLGVVLFELASGAHPFEVTLTAPANAVRAKAASTPRLRIPDMPALERLFLRMMETHEAARPSAGDVAAELTTLAVAASPPIELGALTARGEARNHNLTPQRTPLIGRAAEIADVKGRLLDPAVRLLTLTGPGGTGKTRLAIQVAVDLVPCFEGGVSFVDLAPITEPSLVASTVARTLGVSESGDSSLVSVLCEHLNARGPTLLLLDNFEQVSVAAAVVRELLDGSPGLTVLVTSRHALRIYGEQEFPVSPLPLPEAGSALSPAALIECASVALFVQRAAAVRPGFTLTASNAQAVADICRQLDGLPLAIELAAARVKILPPHELLGRLERRLDVLTGGARDLPERQQTLRRTITWSYDLLTPPEQKLFRRLAVFVGGCTFEAVEAVCNTREDLGVDVLQGVASLVDNSLLVRPVSDDSVPRFFMLETFREYAQEQLRQSGEADETARAHAAYMIVLAEEVPLALNPPEREPWLRTCDAEHDNIRAAVHHLISSRNVEWALRLAAALFRFWEQREQVTEGRETLARVLAMPGATEPTPLRARALYGASVLADVQGDLTAAESNSREACEIYRRFGDVKGVATTMTALAWQTQHGGRYAEATALHAETVSLWQELGETTAVDLARFNTANAARAQGDVALARRILDDLLASSEARHDRRAVASALNGLGDLAAAQADYENARRYHDRSLGAFRQIDDRWGIAQVLTDVADVDLRTENYTAANRALLEALGLFRDLGHQRGVARQLERLAWCAGCQRRDEAAVRLASAAAAIRQRIGTPNKPSERARIDETLVHARARIDQDTYAVAWQEARTATLDSILETAGATDISADRSGV